MDFARTVRSHGCTSLPPATRGDDVQQYEVILRIGARPVPVRFSSENGSLAVRASKKLKSQDVAELEQVARRMFRLDEDFSSFYTLLAGDPELSWAARGAGRMLCSPTVFEDVVKTICTTNCAWSGTIRMVGALVSELGGGAFPLPEEMLKAPPSFYKNSARVGYRGPYLRELAELVHLQKLDLEALRPEFGMADAEVEQRLRQINGVGPYACAHIMMLLGRYRRLVLDSWTRPTFLQRAGKKRCKDSSIERAFKRYGDFAGLAFWLFVTKDWLETP